MVLPGATHAVPDSHACTVGGLGALAFGCRHHELEHVLATQVIATKRPKRMRVRVEGRLGDPCRRQGRGAAHHRRDRRRRRPRLCGRVCRRVPSAAIAIESRLTLCNLAIEMGARSGFVAPRRDHLLLDQRPAVAPQGGAGLDAALAQWRNLASDPDATFDRDIAIDCRRPRAADHLGHRPEPRDRGHRPGAGPDAARRSAPSGAAPGDRLYGACAGHAASPGCRSTASSSAPAPMPGCRTSQPPPRWRADAGRAEASSPWWCRDRAR